MYFHLRFVILFDDLISTMYICSDVSEFEFGNTLFESFAITLNGTPNFSRLLLHSRYYSSIKQFFLQLARVYRQSTINYWH